VTVNVSNAAPPAGFVATFIAHRGTSGGTNPAPLYVHFDATASTSSNPQAKPFFDMLYEWDFGDPQSGNWATDGRSRNKAFGGVAAHVYERPGTYTVALTVTDTNGAKQTATRTIVVDDPDLVWAGNTACVSSSGNFCWMPSRRYTTSVL
jgi:PKD repeat protein